MKRRAFLGGLTSLMVVRSSGAEETKAGTLGKFHTSYSTDAEHKSRASNVQLAAESIDGKKLAPGAVFSFNDAVGERTATFGYSKAVVLRDGLLAEGVGGGACQVASTLYAAALLAGLDIKARVPHSRPSAYIRLGFDATVSYPKLDLKLANTFSDEVTIRARAANGNLDIAIEGPTFRDVTLTSEILERTSITRTLEHDPSIHPDEARRVGSSACAPSSSPTARLTATSASTPIPSFPKFSASRRASISLASPQRKTRSTRRWQR